MGGRSYIGARTKTLIDPAGGAHILQERRPKQTFEQGRFHVVFEAPLKDRALRIKSITAFRMLVVLPDHLTWNEFRLLRQEDLAEELNTRQSVVSRTLKELRLLGFVERKAAGPMTQWRLSMDWGWRGNPASYHRAKRERAKATELRLVAGTTTGPDAA